MTSLVFGAAVSAQEASGETSQDSTHRVIAKVLKTGGDEARQQEGEEGEETGGQIIVVDANGNRHVYRIATKGGVGMLVRPEAVAGQDGEIKVETRAILVGPDGKRELVQLGKGDGAEAEIVLGLAQAVEGEQSGQQRIRIIGDGEADGLATAEVLAQLTHAAAGDYMIGVSCEAVSDALRSQLGIESGLLVTEVFEGSPASGKIEVHDILVAVNDEPVSEVEQLVEAIQAAGKEEGELKIKLLRGGESESVTVAPAKREESSGAAVEWRGIESKELQEMIEVQGESGLTFEAVGPGLIRWRGVPAGEVEAAIELEGGDANADLRAQIEELQRQVEALRKEIGDR
jgi:hypothetical protein